MAEKNDMGAPTPADAIGRYIEILGQWEALTTRQATYDAELAKLEATGDKFRSEWEALQAARRDCVAELEACGLPLEEVVTRAWTLAKAHLYRHGSFPPNLVAEPAARDPRGAE